MIILKKKIISLLIILREVIITSFRYYIIASKGDKELVKVDRLGKLKITDEGIKNREELVISNFFDKFKVNNN